MSGFLSFLECKCRAAGVALHKLESMYDGQHVEVHPVGTMVVYSAHVVTGAVQPW